MTDDYETTLLLEDDEDDENINSTDYSAKPNSKMFNAGVTNRYILFFITSLYKCMCISNSIILFS